VTKVEDMVRCARCETFYVPTLKDLQFPTQIWRDMYCPPCLSNIMSMMPRRGIIIDVEV
jgi:hypothetical protein